MTVPAENYFAAFPAAVRAGNVTLRPLTLGGAIRLAREGVDCGAAVPAELAVRAAFILSGAADYRRFLRRAKFGLRELCNGLERVLNDAFATYVRPPTRKDAAQSLTPCGVGWPLELAEFLCAEYGWGWRAALDTPVATCWALLAASRQRHGDKRGGLDYIERQYEADVKAGRVVGVRL